MDGASRVLSSDVRDAVAKHMEDAKGRGWDKDALRVYFAGNRVDYVTYSRAKAGEPVAETVASFLVALSVHGFPEPNAAHIRQHLDWITEPARGAYDDALIEIAWAPDLVKGDLTAARLFGLDELDLAAAFAIETNNRGRNVYVGASLRLPDTPRDARSGGDAFYVATACPVDIDEDYDATRARLATVCDDGLVVRTGLIPERRSQHWTRLEEPCDDDLAFSHAFGALVAHVGADMKVKDAARIMRLGGTVSFPTARKLAKGYRVEVTTVATPHQARLTSLDALRELAPGDFGPRFDASGRPPGTGEIERDEEGRVVNGRETHFRNLLLEVLRKYQEREKADPSVDDLWDEAFTWFTDDASVDNTDGRWTCADGQRQLRQRAANTMRRLRAGYLAPLGLFSYSTGVRREEVECAARERDRRDHPFADKMAPPPWEGEPAQPGAEEPEPEGAGPDTAAGDPPPRDGPRPRPVVLLDPWQRFVTPDLPLAALPPVLRDYAEAQSMSTGADVNACAMAALAVISGALHHGFSLKMKRSNDWTARPRLWVMLVGDPSSKKTPAIGGAMAPLRACDNENARAHAKDVARWQEVKDAGSQPENKPPSALRLIVNDTTSEKLGEILSKQDRGVLVEQDELAGWIGSMDRYGGGGRGGASADRAFWLKVFDGGPRRVDRITRGDVFIENCSASLLGGIQPRKLEELPNLTSDGMLQRFLPVMMRKAQRPQEVPSQGPFEAYKALVRFLVDVKPAALLMTDEALAEANRFQAFIYEMEGVEGLGDSFVAFLGKLTGLHGSLMLILHMATDPKDGVYSPVSEATAKAAASVLREFAIPHALALYQQSADGVDWDHLRSLASFVLTSKKDRFTVSDFTSGVHALRGQGEWEVARRVSALVAGGWLTTEGVHGVVKAWLIVPGLRELMAERQQAEAERKARVVKALRELSGKGERAA